jgi:hypothetical protein
MSCESFFRPAGVSPPFFRAALPVALFLLAAHRAFMSWESLFRPAAVSPPFFRAGLPGPVRFLFAHRVPFATAILARACGDIFCGPLLDAERGDAVPRIEATRFSKVSICRRIETASSKFLRDMSIRSE